MGIWFIYRPNVTVLDTINFWAFPLYEQIKFRNTGERLEGFVFFFFESNTFTVDNKVQ